MALDLQLHVYRVSMRGNVGEHDPDGDTSGVRYPSGPYGIPTAMREVSDAVEHVSWSLPLGRRGSGRIRFTPRPNPTEAPAPDAETPWPDLYSEHVMDVVDGSTMKRHRMFAGFADQPRFRWSARDDGRLITAETSLIGYRWLMERRRMQPWRPSTTEKPAGGALNTGPFLERIFGEPLRDRIRDDDDGEVYRNGGQFLGRGELYWTGNMPLEADPATVLDTGPTTVPIPDDWDVSALADAGNSPTASAVLDGLLDLVGGTWSWGIMPALGDDDVDVTRWDGEPVTPAEVPLPARSFYWRELPSGSQLTLTADDLTRVEWSVDPTRHRTAIWGRAAPGTNWRFNLLSVPSRAGALRDITHLQNRSGGSGWIELRLEDDRLSSMTDEQVDQYLNEVEARQQPVQQVRVSMLPQRMNEVRGKKALELRPGQRFTVSLDSGTSQELLCTEVRGSWTRPHRDDGLLALTLVGQRFWRAPLLGVDLESGQRTGGAGAMRSLLGLETS